MTKKKYIFDCRASEMNIKKITSISKRIYDSVITYWLDRRYSDKILPYQQEIFIFQKNLILPVSAYHKVSQTCYVYEKKKYTCLYKNCFIEPCHFLNP